MWEIQEDMLYKFKQTQENLNRFKFEKGQHHLRICKTMGGGCFDRVFDMS